MASAGPFTPKIMQAIFLILVGLCAVIGFAADVDWLMDHRRVRPLVSIHGREKARRILLVTNICIVVAGFIWLYWLNFV